MFLDCLTSSKESAASMWLILLSLEFVTIKIINNISTHYYF